MTWNDSDMSPIGADGGIPRIRNRFIDLCSFQPWEVVKRSFDENGVYLPDASMGPWADDLDFMDSYEWMSECMDSHGIANESGTDGIVWAWAKFTDGHGNGTLGPPVGSNEFDYESNDLLYLRMGIDRVLLSDFDAWHIVLNNCSERRYGGGPPYIPDNGLESLVLIDPLDSNRMHSIPFIQAAFRCITPGDVVDVIKKDGHSI